MAQTAPDRIEEFNPTPDGTVNKKHDYSPQKPLNINHLVAAPCVYDLGGVACVRLRGEWLI